MLKFIGKPLQLLNLLRFKNLKISIIVRLIMPVIVLNFVDVLFICFGQANVLRGGVFNYVARS